MLRAALQKGGRPGNRRFPVFSAKAEKEIEIIFGATCACRKFPDPCAPGAHTPVTDVTGEGESKGGTESPL